MGKCRVTECWTYRSIDRAVYKPDAVAEPGREFGLQVRSAAVAGGEPLCMPAAL